MKVITTTGKVWQRLCVRHLETRRRIQERVRTILEDVRLHGDEAVLRYTRRLDGVRLKPKQFRVCGDVCPIDRS